MTKEQWHSQRLQHYWNLTIRVFCVISLTLIGEVLTFCREAVGIFYRPSQLGKVLSGSVTPDQSGHVSNGNKEVVCISQSSSIIGISPSDCFISYPVHLLGRSYPSAEKQSVYSTAPANWASSTIRWCAKSINNYSLKVSYWHQIVL